MRPFLLVASMVCTLVLAGCSFFRPYQMQIEQGIALSPTQIAKLQNGMTEDQVSYLLGSPNLVDPYRPNTWYYIYTTRGDEQPSAEHKLIVYFDTSGKVTHFEEQ